MKKFILSITVCFVSVISFSQPWLAPLKICSGSNGTSFSGATVFQDSSGVATVIRVGTSNSDTLIAAFQWFPMPMGNPGWDKVAVKYSYNGGASWTTPTTCTFVGLPAGFQRPFDPTLLQLPNGKIRMYFSCGPTIGSTGSINTYAANSTDGKTYTFEPVASFDDAAKNAIDPAVGLLGSTYYYNSSTGVNGDPSHRAISTDAISFTTQATFPYDGIHVWLGNYLADGSALKFYGCGNSIWMNSTTNGSTWSGYVNTNVGMGADPAVVKTKSGTYIMIYTGPPNPTGMETRESISSDILVYPVTFNDFILVRSKSAKPVDVQIIDQLGKKVFEEKSENQSQIRQIHLQHLSAGIYYMKLSRNGISVTRKIVKAE
ncbi:MAG: repeat-like domain [Bacteroidetes bacterium]|jgi:hypothetical protein|nr:repeat-like domain [Bacteroidota bacterium]